MDLQVVYNQLLFWVNLKQGGWYPPEELDAIVDKGQLSYYKDCFIKYGTGQRLTDALAPFKSKSNFTTDDAGFLDTPEDYMDLIDIEPIINGVPVTCPVLNEDERTYRRRSQVIPNTTVAPFAEEVTNWNFQLYPQQEFSGNFTYYRRPTPPLFRYTLISGRIINYDPVNSQQLGWGDDEIQPLLIWTLQSIGINLSEQDVGQFAELKTQQNLLSAMKI